MFIFDILCDSLPVPDLLPGIFVSLLNVCTRFLLAGWSIHKCTCTVYGSYFIILLSQSL